VKQTYHDLNLLPIA